MKRLIITATMAVILLILFAGCTGKQNGLDSTTPTPPVQNNTAQTDNSVASTETQQIESKSAPAEQGTAQSIHWQGYTMSLAKVTDNADSAASGMGAGASPQGRYVQVLCNFSSDSAGKGGFDWKAVSKIPLADVQFNLSDKGGKTYPVMNMGTTDVTFAQGVFSSPDYVKNIFFVFDIPANISVDDLFVEVAGQKVALKALGE